MLWRFPSISHPVNSISLVCYLIALFWILLITRQVNIMPNYPYPKKIAKFCFLVVLCQVGSSLQHTKSCTKSHLGKKSYGPFYYLPLKADFFSFFHLSEKLTEKNNIENKKTLCIPLWLVYKLYIFYISWIVKPKNRFL